MATRFLQPDPKKLKAARLGAGISGGQLAKLLQVQPDQIYNIERGFSEPRGSQLLIWANACNTTCEKLSSLAEPGEFYFRKKAKKCLNPLDKINAV